LTIFGPLEIVNSKIIRYSLPLMDFL